MALITFEDLPSTNTPLNATNLNNNFNELKNTTVNVITPSLNNISELKAWLITNSAPTGNYICTFNFSGSISTALVEKASNNYLSFIHYSYTIVAKQYRYVNGTWLESELGDVGEWQNITYQNTYSSYSASYNALQYRKTGNQVFVRGMIKSTATNPIGTNATAGTLPSTASPAKELYFLANNADTPISVSIDTSGAIKIFNTSTSWISLDGINFFVD